ncbi:MerR family transcriptional regulator [Ochrobactrum quorumnocens]|uniref:MerR family transcriptional regulator n=1 Tax=Ochrobactrum quorumnocens TaxID=271865 RepID=A0A5N1JFL1_9HYPH|nr:MerR family transcriptional regulator [[Ochrobactrum] quorumnocens]KAA9349529.1 MerR family transcriptional regulator [[Ochrobactrum] quorumnocens]
MKKEMWISASQCAKRLGLTVRALRVYEEYGLIHPRRTEKNWRVYGLEDVARLNEILTLKRLGLGLTQIRQFLSGQSTNIQNILEIQRISLTEIQEKTQRSLSIIDSLKAKMLSNNGLSMDDLLELARDTNKGHSAVAPSVWKRYEQARPRTEARVDPNTLGVYVGYYLNFDNLIFNVFERDGNLFVRMTGSPELEMLPESQNKFFEKNLHLQITFPILPDNSVQETILHRDGIEYTLPRVDETIATAIEENISWRAENKVPADRSEELLLSLIAFFREEPLDYARLHPVLSASVTLYSNFLRKDLRALGDVETFQFKGVSPNGLDIYDVAFENGGMECGMKMGNDDRYVNVHFRPLL